LLILQRPIRLSHDDDTLSHSSNSNDFRIWNRSLHDNICILVRRRGRLAVGTGITFNLIKLQDALPCRLDESISQ
jgi:hypothetical protein